MDGMQRKKKKNSNLTRFAQTFLFNRELKRTNENFLKTKTKEKKKKDYLVLNSFCYLEKNEFGIPHLSALLCSCALCSCVLYSKAVCNL